MPHVWSQLGLAVPTKGRRQPSLQSPRRGLSTLEMVLSLPILLAVMALIINFGTVASWKLRGLAVARHQLWSQREGRSGSTFSPIQYWPQNYLAAGQSPLGAGTRGWLTTSLNMIEQVHNAHLPVARGPLVGDGVPPPAQPFLVNQDLLNPARSMFEGHATVERNYPLLQRLGPYRLRAAGQLLNGPWTFPALGARDNDDFRAPLLFAVPATPDPSYAQRYIQAVARIYYAPFQNDLWPLDRDDEFLYWKQRFPNVPAIQNRGHDFIARFAWLGSFCDLDPLGVQSRVDLLVDRIRGTNGQTSVAENMRQEFKGFFEDVKQELENLLNATPPPPPDVRAQLQREIQALEAELALLQAPLN